MASPASEFLHDIQSLLQHCRAAYDEGNFTDDECDYSHRCLQQYIGIIDSVATADTPVLLQLAVDLRDWLTWLESLENRPIVSCNNLAGLEVTMQFTGEQGRPRLQISRNMLLYLRENNFSWTQVATMLGVGRRTVTRRVNEFSLQCRNMFVTLSDNDLRIEIEQIHRDFTHCGCRMVRAILMSHGIHASLHRVQPMLQEIDPVSSGRRWGALVHRRRYSVKAANSLWHIDGHHSLIRWGFIIHAGIDGYSRMVVYMQCNTSNTSETACTCFRRATERFGVPSRVRTDKGCENWDIGRFMLAARGEGRGSFITGPSTHNQRIERLWRDVFRAVAQVFYGFFYWLEDNGHLDILSWKHLYALQYVFKPRINAALEVFADGWNAHPLRTEQNWTPNQIFVNSRIAHNEDFHDEAIDLLNYGRDFDDVVVTQDDQADIIINEILCPLDENQLHDLVTLLPDVTAESADFGFTFYITCRDYIDSQNME